VSRSRKRARRIPLSLAVETHAPPANIPSIQEPSAKPVVTPKKSRRPSKLVIDGIEIQRPVMPPVTPLWRLRRGARIAYEKLADERVAGE
jgi:hypothetical protein